MKVHSKIPHCINHIIQCRTWRQDCHVSKTSWSWKRISEGRECMSGLA